MKLENIETELGNRILEELKNQGWKIVQQYSPMAFDKGVDFDSYKLRKAESTLNFEWTNWLEWEIIGEESELQTIAKAYKLGFE